MGKEVNLKKETKRNEKRVCHAYDTGNSEREDGKTWIEYWEEVTKLRRPEKCPCCEKTLAQIQKENPGKKVEMVGAHVHEYIEYANDSKQLYITPTCNICNDMYKKQVCIAERKKFNVSEKLLVKV